MSVRLPTIVETYVKAANAGDAKAGASCERVCGVISRRIEGSKSLDLSFASYLLSGLI